LRARIRQSPGATYAYDILDHAYSKDEPRALVFHSFEMPWLLSLGMPPAESAIAYAACGALEFYRDCCCIPDAFPLIDFRMRMLTQAMDDDKQQKTTRMVPEGFNIHASGLPPWLSAYAAMRYDDEMNIVKPSVRATFLNECHNLSSGESRAFFIQEARRPMPRVEDKKRVKTV